MKLPVCVSIQVSDRGYRVLYNGDTYGDWRLTESKARKEAEKIAQMFVTVVEPVLYQLVPV